MENNYCVYKHTTPSGKVYIGITRQEPTKRWNNGKGYYYNVHFNRAIKKYGWENIKHEILVSDLTKEEASDYEKMYISIFNTTDSEYGYNMTSGGEIGYQLTDDSKNNLSKAHKKINKDGRNKKRNIGGKNPCSKTIYQYTKEGTFIERYDSVADAVRILVSLGKAKSIESARGSILRVANRTELNVNGYKITAKSAYGYKWSYVYVASIDNNVEIKKRKSQTREISQYSEKGKFIKTYKSIKEIADKLGVSQSHITQCARGQRISAHGYLWAYTDTDNIDIFIRDKVKRKMFKGMWSGNNHQARPIEQYDFDGNYIKTFSCIAEASRTLKISSSTISACAQGNRRSKSAGGFIWIYSDDVDKTHILERAKNKGCEKVVKQYTLSGEYIKTYSSIKEVKKELGSNSHICDVCMGKRNSALGYIWKYA